MITNQEHEHALRQANDTIAAQAEALNQAREKVVAQEKELSSLKALIAGELASLQQWVNTTDLNQQINTLREEVQATRAEHEKFRKDSFEQQKRYFAETAKVQEQLVAANTRAFEQVRRYRFREGIVEEALTDFTRDLGAAVNGGNTPVNDLVVRFGTLMGRVKDAWSVMPAFSNPGHSAAMEEDEEQQQQQQ